MRVKLLTLRYVPALGGFDDRPLSEFVRDKQVLAVREHFFAVHDMPHLACLVTYQEGSEQTHPSKASARQGKRESKRGAGLAEILQDLDTTQQALFQSLREWRAARARKDGVPPYVVFTNRELAALVRARPQSPTGLQSVEGVGPGKVERYGAALLKLLEHDGPATTPPPEARSQDPE